MYDITHRYNTCSIIYMELTGQKEKATGEKGPATVLKLGTYALTRSFSHASHGDQLRSLVPHALMYRSQVCCYPATLKTCALRLVLCAV